MMVILEQSILVLVAPLVVVYVALLGIGYLLIDEKEWRSRPHQMKKPALPISSDLSAAKTVSVQRRLVTPIFAGRRMLPDAPASPVRRHPRPGNRNPPT